MGEGWDGGDIMILYWSKRCKKGENFMYYRRKGGNVHHWRRDCSQVPGDVFQSRYWMTLSRYANPPGEPCAECTEKDRREGIVPATRQ